MISDRDSKKWLAELESLGAELGVIGARMKAIAIELDAIREKLL